MRTASLCGFKQRTSIVSLAAALAVALALRAWSFETSAPLQSAADALLTHARYLASEQLAGRGVDTPGIALARDYIASEFAKYGLRPGGSGGFAQTFDVAVGVDVKPPSELSIGAKGTLALYEDWIPLGLSASGKAQAEVVFAGYGISAKDYGYDDYETIDAKGKIVLVLRDEPPPRSDKSPFRAPPRYSQHAALRVKANNARNHGAVGMILVNLNAPGDERAELLSTRSSLWRGGGNLLAAQIKRRAAEEWLAAHGVSLAALKEKIDREEKPASTALSGVKAALQVALEETRRPAHNVVAVLSGSDPALKNQYVVIGAHYDHLGFGEFGSLTPRFQGQIHPGADDNASGTAVLLEVARRLRQLPTPPPRSIVFVAFSAEELGLHGSRHFVERSPFAASTMAMLNMDMVGRMRDNRLTVFGTRSGDGLSALVLSHAKSLGLQVNESDGVGRSDHMSFYNRRIPVLHFFTGLHSDYHSPTDTWDKLNIDGMMKVSDLVLATAIQLAYARKAVAFTALPARPPRTDMVPSSGSMTAYLGTIPDYSATTDGVPLAGIVGGSPAARAGLRQGDVIIRLGAKTIETIEDLTAALDQQKAGDEVEIVVRRDQSAITLRTILGSPG